MQSLTILGSTGSIGQNTLDVVLRHPDQFSVAALSAHRNIDKLAAQVALARPSVVAVPDGAAADSLKTQLKAAGVPLPEILHGMQLSGESALEVIASLPSVSTVMAAIVGAAGLAPTLAAARAGKRVLLANKEALVMSGALFMHAVREANAVLLPIDSEHNAVFQSLPREFRIGDPKSLAACGVERILLTASGGPFRLTPIERLRHVTPEQAVAHPNWVMGRKISVDSATMMNKGLEVIEAHWLFAAPASAINIVVHPQSVIHSMVQYVDGSVLAQLGQPDMRTPIANALAWPKRVAAGVAPLDFTQLAKLEFEALDEARFPCVRLAYDAMAAGGTAPAVLNAANEVAVEAFLNRELPYLGISRVIDTVLAAADTAGGDSLESVHAADIEARVAARRAVRAERESVTTAMANS
jgi:1-deoxy-D-xylulose-5-phosphate reductoisomerase